MPWSSIADLKASDTYKNSDTLKKMPEFRLRRFIEVFNAIHQQKMSTGAPKEEADATAFAMAYASAKRFQPTPKGATLEPQKHYFATMMPLQFSMGGEVEDMSFNYVTANMGLVNAAISGNAFNLDHRHTEPLGVIHRILPISEVPLEAAAKLAKQTPFVTEASYFEGTPDGLKQIETLSAEWLDVVRPDGRTEVISPDSFAVTEDPATDQSLGVGKLAKVEPQTAALPPSKRAVASSAKAYQSRADSTTQESHEMADTPEPEKTGPEVGALQEKVAALSGDLELMKKAKDAAESKYATLMADFSAATGRIAALEKIAHTSAAESAVDKGIEDGKFSTEDRGYWVQEYMDRGPEKFATMLAKLPVAHIGVAKAKSATALANDSGANAAIERMSKGVKANLTNGRAA